MQFSISTTKDQIPLALKQMQKFAEIVEEITMSDLREAEKEESKNFNLQEWENDLHKNKLS